MFTEMGVVLRNRLCVMGLMTVETRRMKRAAHPIGDRTSFEVRLSVGDTEVQKIFKSIFTRNGN
jgi:hypothetical protein